MGYGKLNDSSWGIVRAHVTFAMPRQGPISSTIACWIIFSVCGLIAPIAVLWLIAPSATLAARVDPYLEKALAKIDASLFSFPHEYGFRMTDTAFEDGKPQWKSRITFYTSHGRIHSREDRFDAVYQTEPSNGHLIISQRIGRGDAVSVSWARKDGRDINSLSVGEKLLSVDIGRAEGFSYGTEEYNKLNPYRQPFQVLKNPCFVRLEIDNADLTPAMLREQALTRLPDEEDKKVFEFRGKPFLDRDMKPTKFFNFLRLYFSPEHDDILCKSEHGTAQIVENGEWHLEHHDVYEIEQWQRLNDGTWAPKRYSLRYSHERGKNADGVVLVRRGALVREISNAVIGPLDEALFDPSKLTEFQKRFDATTDMAHGGVTILIPPGPTPEKGRFLVVLANVAAVFAIAVIIWFWRRRRRFADGGARARGANSP